MGKRLDPAGGIPSDGLERNWDGQTRQEFLEMLQSAHDDGNVQIDDGWWLVEDDAAVEIGAAEGARRRAEMTPTWSVRGRSWRRSRGPVRVRGRRPAAHDAALQTEA